LYKYWILREEKNGAVVGALIVADSALLANNKLAFSMPQDLGKYLEKEDRPQPKEKGRYAKTCFVKHTALCHLLLTTPV
jgi:hypothetical protein